MIVIVDTNILFAALRSKNSKLRETLVGIEHIFYTPNFLVVEIFKHKERIIKKAKTSEEEIYEFLNKVLQHIHFINEELITEENANIAYELCKDVDEKDTPFVALTLELSGKLWTQDKQLRKGLKAKGFDNFFDA